MAKFVYKGDVPRSLPQFGIDVVMPGDEVDLPIDPSAAPAGFEPVSAARQAKAEAAKEDK